MRPLSSAFRWIVLDGVMAILTFYFGQQYLFAAASCPNLALAALSGTTSIMLIGMGFRTVMGRNNSAFAHLRRAFAIPFVGLPLALLLGTVGGEIPQVQALVCPLPSCPHAANAQALFDDGKFEGAEDVARLCLAESQDTTCQGTCQIILAKSLYEQTTALMQQTETPVTQLECATAFANIAEVVALQATTSSLPQAAIEDRRQRLQSRCATPTPTATATPTPTPTITPTSTPVPRALQLTVLRQQVNDAEMVIDVQVEEARRLVNDLSPDRFRLFADEQELAISSVDQIASNDPVCIVGAIDNSGSIVQGPTGEDNLENVRSAISALNQQRQQSDELGLVRFGAGDEITLVQAPQQNAQLTPEVINGEGSNTALWDGISKALEASSSCTNQRRYIIVVTDGDDNDSRKFRGLSTDQIVDRLAATARAQQVSICTIGVASESLHPQPLQQLASETNCIYSSANNFAEIESLVGKIVGNIRDFYRVTANISTLQPGIHQARLRVEGGEVILDVRR